jgi:hypothetical protein
MSRFPSFNIVVKVKRVSVNILRPGTLMFVSVLGISQQTVAWKDPAALPWRTRRRSFFAHDPRRESLPDDERFAAISRLNIPAYNWWNESLGNGSGPCARWFSAHRPDGEATQDGGVHHTSGSTARRRFIMNFRPVAVNLGSSIWIQPPFPEVSVSRSADPVFLILVF